MCYAGHSGGSSISDLLAQFQNPVLPVTLGVEPGEGYAYSERTAGAYNFWKINNEAAGSVALPQVRYDVGNRKRDKVRSSLNWQATDRLALTGTVDYNLDRYTESPFGLQRSEGWVYGLDGSFQMMEDFSINAFFTREDKKNRQVDPVSVPLLTQWSANLSDNIDAFGLGAKKSGLMGGRLELGGDLVVIRATSPAGLSSSVSTNVTTTSAVGPLPDIKSNSEQLRLNAKYTVSKSSAVRFNYTMMHLSSDNYAYQGLQTGAATNCTATAVAGCYSVLLPTNEKAPNYRVSVISATYIYSFQ
jgi:hypothetical protein